MSNIDLVGAGFAQTAGGRIFESEIALKKVRRVISDALGSSVRHLSTEIIGSPRAASEARTGRGHAKYVFQLSGDVGAQWKNVVRDGKIAAFVKTGRNLVSSPACLKTVVSSDFYVPVLFGAFQIRGARFEVWEYLDGESSKFARLERPLQIKLMRAIAGVNAVQCASLPFKIRWLDHPLQWFERRCEVHGAGRPGPWREILDRVRALDGRKQCIVASLAGEAAGRLAHNDLKPGNVIISAERVRIVDWEKATRSVAGADLRFLVGIKDRGALLDCYLERMGELGVSLQRDRVVHAFEIIEGFRRIRAGCANGSLQNSASGLALVEARLAA